MELSNSNHKKISQGNEISDKPEMSTCKTATNETRRHYERPEVKKTILHFCQDGTKQRALNGDKGWYISSGNGAVRLRGPEDYEDTVFKFRTLYATLDLFDPGVFNTSSPWDEKTGKPEQPIGTFRDCQGYTLGADIDSIGNITEDPAIKLAVEDAAKFLVAMLNEAGISKSVHCLYSGGGIYILIHHAIFQAKPEWNPEERDEAFRSLTGAYNMFLADAERKFFKLHPEHRGKVKIDKINNQKRKFKCIFSIHKKYDLAVVPLDPGNIKINFDQARHPLSDDILRKGEEWYVEYDLAELDAVKTQLEPYAGTIEEDLKSRKELSGDFEISKRSEPIPVEDWPSCMKNILKKAEPDKGPHRACAVLASYLYQAGWSEEEALKIWMPVANQGGVEQRIFDLWYGQMCCPNCSTIQETNAGYPKLGLGGLGYCEPEGGCEGCRWPGGYNKWSVSRIEDSLKRDISALNNPEIIKALGDLKWTRPIEYTLLLKKVKINGEVKKVLEKEIARLKKEMEKPETPPKIREKAIEILENDNPMQYIVESCGRMVLGADKAFKKLICCVSVQNILQSTGLHPKLNGESGGGKTWALLTFAHHLPPETVLKGSMSAKSGYYHNDGNRILRILDDYQAGNEDLDTTIKQTSSEFHQPYTHRTVANNKGLKLQIGSEQTWAITSVDSSQDIQVLNRQIPINVNDSEELTKDVNRQTIERYGEGEPQFPVDDNVLVSREIFRKLREEGYINVRVPFYDRIEWFDTSNRRNPSIFMDLLIGITAMNRFQREKDADGYYLATEDDFHAAKELFVERDAEELVHRLTKRERQFAELLAKNKDGMTREEVAKALDLSPTRISHLASGEKGKGGLSQKLPGFAVQEITDYEIYTPGVEKRAVRKTLYKLEGYNPLEGFDAIVKLRGSAPSADGVRPKVRNENNAEIDNSEREKREIDRGSADNAGCERGNFLDAAKGNKSSLSLAGKKNPHSHQEKTTVDTKESRTVERTGAHSTHSEAPDDGAKSSSIFQENGNPAISPHPRKDLPTPGRKSDKQKEAATCPVCEVDIGPGHSSQIFEGISYCTSCPRHLSSLRASVGELIEKNGIAPSEAEIYEHMASKNSRPPKKEFIPSMLRVLGFEERDGKWFLSSAKDVEAPA
jgi:hypothetical protein